MSGQRKAEECFAPTLCGAYAAKIYPIELEDLGKLQAVPQKVQTLPWSIDAPYISLLRM